MDLATLGAFADSAKVDLYHPDTLEPILTDDGETMWVEVWSPESDTMKKVANAIINRNIAKMARGGNRLKSFTAEQNEAQNLEQTIKSVKSWNIMFNGGTPEISVASISEVFRALPWVRKQVEAAAGDLANFMTS